MGFTRNARLFSSLCLAGLAAVTFLISAASAQTATKPIITVTSGHKVATIAFEPRGRWMVTGGWDNTVKVWDIGNSRLLRTLTGHKTYLDSVAVSPDSTRILSKDSDGEMRLWDAETGGLIKTYKTEGRGTIFFAKDGRSLLTQDYYSLLRIDLQSGATTASYNTGQKDGMIRSFAVPVNENLIVAGDDESNIYSFDMQSRRQTKRWKAHTGNFDFNKVRLSQDGRLLVTVPYGEPRILKIWEPRTGKLVRQIRAHDDTLQAAIFSTDGNVLFSASDDKTVKAWSVTSGSQLWSISLNDEPSELALSPDGKSLVVGGNGLTFLDPANGRINRTLHGPALVADVKVNLLPDGNWLLAGTPGFSIWDIDSGQRVRLFGENPKFVSPVVAPADGRWLVASAKDNNVSIWDIKRETLLRKLEIPHIRTDDVRSVALSPDGSKIATATHNYKHDTDNGKTIRLWDASSGSELRSMRAYSKTADAVAFSPDGQLIASIGTDKDWESTLRLWNPATGQLVREMVDRDADKVLFSADGRLVAAGGDVDSDASMKIFDVASGRKIRALKHGSSFATGLAFSGDARLAAIVGGLNDISAVFDIEKGTKLFELSGNTGQSASVVFTTNAEKIIKANNNSTIGIWSTKTGELLATTVHADSGEWITITPEGFFVSSQNGSSLVHVVRGFETTSIDQLYQSLFRPDLVREKLKGDPHGLVREAAAGLDLDKAIASGAPPEGRFLSGDRQTVSSDQVTLEAELADRGGGIGRVEWRVNGVTLGIDQSDGAGNSRLRISRQLALDEGDNRIEIVAYNARNLIASEPVRLTVKSEQAQNEKPRLFVLAVGVNDYFDGRLKLNFPVADAQAIADGFAAAGKDVYESVSVTTLLDADVRRDKLDRTFSELSGKIRSKDVFVFFLAGHGKTVDGRYHFIPQDFRYTGESSITQLGVSQEQFQTWFARVAARKTLLLFDTCESGTLTGEKVATRGLELVASLERLTRAVGRTVLSASTDDTPALEGYRGHGVFSYSVLNALGKADANGDGFVEITELAGFVDAEVPDISQRVFNFRQVPQMKLLGSNFPLVKPTIVLNEEPGSEQIPRKPSHVLVEATDVFGSSDGGAPESRLQPGTLVTLMRTEQGWTLIARDGKRVGFVASKSLAAIQ